MKNAHNNTLSPQLKHSAADAPISRKEESMNTKITILYERLSHEDGRENESLSIENQKAYLEEYANKNGFTNLVHLTDDGYSGTRWDRPGFIKMMDEIERGNVESILARVSQLANRIGSKPPNYNVFRKIVMYIQKGIPLV